MTRRTLGIKIAGIDAGKTRLSGNPRSKKLLVCLAGFGLTTSNAPIRYIVNDREFSSNYTILEVNFKKPKEGLNVEKKISAFTQLMRELASRGFFKGREIVFLGHSLGGVILKIIGGKLRGLLGVKPKIVTIGSPTSFKDYPAKSIESARKHFRIGKELDGLISEAITLPETSPREAEIIELFFEGDHFVPAPKEKGPYRREIIRVKNARIHPKTLHNAATPELQRKVLQKLRCHLK